MKLEITNKGDGAVMVGGLPLMAGARATFEFDEDIDIVHALAVYDPASEGVDAVVPASEEGVTTPDAGLTYWPWNNNLPDWLDYG